MTKGLTPKMDAISVLRRVARIDFPAVAEKHHEVGLAEAADHLNETAKIIELAAQWIEQNEEIA